MPFDDSISGPATMIVEQNFEDNSFGTTRKSHVALKVAKGPKFDDNCRLESVDMPPSSPNGRLDLNDI